MKLICSLLLLLLLVQASAQQQQEGFSFTDRKDQKQIDLLWNGKLLTAYCYYDSSRKPVLFPVNTVDGITVTRGFPFAPRAGERTDHPHHTGIWMNYESVNGLDFWNNSTAIPPGKRHLYGTVQHVRELSRKASARGAELVTLAHWNRPDGHTLLEEKITHRFSVEGNRFVIDRTSVLTAKDMEVLFKDVKDGFLAIRVARELEMPSQQADVFVDAQGNQTAVPKINNEGVNGMYVGSTGLRGDSVWSSKGPWVVLTGVKDGKDVSILILDHPSNTGYPSYWHARGYGLFAVNPLERKIFSNGKEELNLKLQPGQSVTFRYRVVVQSGVKMDPAEAEKLSKAFHQVKN